jgi:hypothetical protein
MALEKPQPHEERQILPDLRAQHLVLLVQRDSVPLLNG